MSKGRIKSRIRNSFYRIAGVCITQTFSGWSANTPRDTKSYSAVLSHREQLSSLGPLLSIQDHANLFRKQGRASQSGWVRKGASKRRQKEHTGQKSSHKVRRVNLRGVSSEKPRDYLCASVCKARWSRKWNQPEKWAEFLAIFHEFR